MSTFRTSTWDPYLIVGQIACNQCFFYSAECILFLIWSMVSTYKPSLDHVFIPFTARPVSIIQLISAALVGYALSHVVQRARSCLDFSCTLHFWHLILVVLYNWSFPSQLMWWILQLISLMLMTVVGEYVCMKKETAEIPLQMNAIPTGITAT